MPRLAAMPTEAFPEKKLRRVRAKALLAARGSRSGGAGRCLLTELVCVQRSVYVLEAGAAGARPNTEVLQMHSKLQQDAGGVTGILVDMSFSVAGSSRWT